MIYSLVTALFVVALPFGCCNDPCGSCFSISTSIDWYCYYHLSTSGIHLAMITSVSTSASGTHSCQIRLLRLLPLRIPALHYLNYSYIILVEVAAQSLSYFFKLPHETSAYTPGSRCARCGLLEGTTPDGLTSQQGEIPSPPIPTTPEHAETCINRETWQTSSHGSETS